MPSLSMCLIGFLLPSLRRKAKNASRDGLLAKMAVSKSISVYINIYPNAVYTTDLNSN